MHTETILGTQVYVYKKTTVSYYKMKAENKTVVSPTERTYIHTCTYKFICSGNATYAKMRQIMYHLIIYSLIYIYFCVLATLKIFMTQKEWLLHSQFTNLQEVSLLGKGSRVANTH